MSNLINLYLPTMRPVILQSEFNNSKLIWRLYSMITKTARH